MLFEGFEGFEVAMTVIFILSSLLAILLVYFLVQNIIFYKRFKNLSTAEKLLKLLETTTGLDFPIRFRAWDGSETGPKGAPVIHFKSKSIARWIIWSPRFPSLGIIRALVDGNDLDIDGDFNDFCQRFDVVGLTLIECSFPNYIKFVVTSSRMSLVAVSIFGWSLLCLPPTIPQQEFKPNSTFKKFTRDADKATVEVAYSSNKFFDFMLGPTMVYSCAYYETPDMSLDEAQVAKLELSCRELGLKEGMTLLDIGCGWGSFVIHAAQKHGVTAKGITLCEHQCKYAQETIKRLGLEKMVDVQFMDFRDLKEIEHYDAVACFEMLGQIGRKNDPLFAHIVHRALKPGGKLLLQEICFGFEMAKYEKSVTTRIVDHPVVEGYFFPSSDTHDMYEYKFLDRVGFEVNTFRNLREHYVITCRDWVKNMQENEEEILKVTSPGFLKCFKLGVAFFGNGCRIGLATSDQFLCTKANQERDMRRIGDRGSRKERASSPTFAV